MQDLRGQAGLAKAPVFASRRPGAASHTSGSRARLERFVEAEILPRLLHSHPPAPQPREAEIHALEALLESLLAGDPAAASWAYERAAEACESDAQLMLDVLAPAARRLGEMWEEDSCDFFAVTQGLSRLHAMLTQVRLRRGPPLRAGPSMLLLTAPGETHVFGADMAAELFRREGWNVERGDWTRLGRLKERPFAALGVSCGCEKAAEGLPAFLAAARAEAGRVKPAIIVGGAVFATRPTLASELGADFSAVDPEATRRISKALVERQQL